MTPATGNSRHATARRGDGTRRDFPGTIPPSTKVWEHQKAAVVDIGTGKAPDSLLMAGGDRGLPDFLTQVAERKGARSPSEFMEGVIWVSQRNQNGRKRLSVAARGWGLHLHDFSTPEARAMLAELLGAAEYQRRFAACHACTAVNVVAGHQITPLDTSRGVVYSVGDTGRVFATLAAAATYAKLHPAKV